MIVPRTSPEPARDLMAQVAALASKHHPKRAVFIAAGNEGALHIVRRAEGMLITSDESIADSFSSANPLTDEFMAGILGYPEPKSEMLRFGLGTVVQARDCFGNVITEALCSEPRIMDTMEGIGPHVPIGGELALLSPETMQERRKRQ